MPDTKTLINGVTETMLQTLYARAKESQKEKHYIYDEKAIEIVSKLNYDFSLADKDKMMSNGVIARTIVLDNMVSDFLDKHNEVTVINIACGLDTRCYRMEGKYKYWYNIDLPETISIRKKFLPESGPIYQIAKSAMDESWVKDIFEATGTVLIIIEGLTMYLNEIDVKKIFQIINDSFKNVTVFVETMSPFVVKNVKEKSIDGSNAKFTWGVKNGKELESILIGFKNIYDISLTKGMEVFIPAYKIISKIPLIRNISNKILVMENR